jgi:hypothetical protein
MTKEQKEINRKLIYSLRTGNTPILLFENAYPFYRDIAYRIGKETGKKFAVKYNRKYNQIIISEKK